MRNIIVVPYDPNWPAEFEKIKTELTAALGSSALAIEHIGSTAVPGLHAKPVIDIDIVIEKDMFDTVRLRLGEIGYTHAGDQGVEGREAFRYAGKRHLMEHHLYVCDKDAGELRRHLSLRDFLRNNDEYRGRYGRIKIEMAKQHPHDIDCYLAGKQPLIMEIYKKCGLCTAYKQTGAGPGK